MTLSEFDRLEERVKQLLSECETLREENLKMTEFARLKSLETASLKKKLKKLDTERGRVRGRVDSLLARLDSLIQ